MNPTTPTPVESQGGVLVKREDLLVHPDHPGVVGGKLRLALGLVAFSPATGPVVGWGGRRSTSAAAIAVAARLAGRPARFHTAAGPDTSEMTLAQHYGAEIIRHRPGYATLCRARARAECADTGTTLWPTIVPMRCAVAEQVKTLIPHAPRRVVVATGSGITLAGILEGLQEYLPGTPVLAVLVGADPNADHWSDLAPASPLTLIRCSHKYDTEIDATLGDLRLDPLYEAKAVPHLCEGDLLWNLGTRAP